MLNPVGRPLLDTVYYLFAKFFVFNCPGRLRGKCEDRFLVRRRLFQSYALCYHGLEKFRTKHPTYLFENFFAQSCSLVVQGHHDAEDFQTRIWTGLDLLDRLQ